MAASSILKGGTIPQWLGYLARAGSLAWLALAGIGATEGDPFESQRERMVQQQIEARGIDDPRVLEAMRAVPRHRFVPDRLQTHAYLDRPLPIGHDQTISQPYIVAFMTELLDVEPGHKILEVGTGSGYQAAVLHQISTNLHTIEIVEPLAKRAEGLLVGEFGFEKGQVRHGNGYLGLKEEAPFDRIMVTAAPDKIPEALMDQLRPGGKMVIPVGPTGGAQRLMLVTKRQDGTLERKTVLPVRFVPMTGKPNNTKDKQ